MMPMWRKYFMSIFLLSLWTFSLLLGQEIPNEGVNSITPQEMMAHVRYLASDDMRGRNTPSPELDSCAAYIARQFASYGLEPIGSEEIFLQPFFVLKIRLSTPNTLDLATSEGIKSYQIKEDFVPLQMTANQKISEVPIVFAGYGITAPEYNYDDYQGMDVRKKVVLIFTNEPQDEDSTSIFNGSKRTEHSNVHVKVMNAIEHGAIGVLLVGNPLTRFRRPPNPWPSLMRHAPQDAAPLTLDEKTEKKIVCVQIGKELANDIMEGTGHSLEERFQKIDETFCPQSFKIQEKNVTMETHVEAERFPTQNVVGLWEGSDPVLKREFVIIGAHYDHIGVINDTVYNGADDNASGTAGMLEIAQAFSQCKIRPKRSILFMAFAGEEKGLFGSRYYTENPSFPLDKTIAMLTVDMISRNDTNSVSIIGAPTSSDLKEMNEKANASVGMTLAYDQEEYFRQSDHYSFYRKDIPVLFYNSKDTPDLHKPSDDPEKVIPEKMASIGKLVFSTAWLVANRTERPNFNPIK